MTTFRCDWCEQTVTGYSFGDTPAETICYACWLNYQRVIEEAGTECRQMAEAFGIWGLTVRHACGHPAHYSMRAEPTEATRAEMAAGVCYDCRKEAAAGSGPDA